LIPGNNVSVTVFEMYNAETVSSKTFTFPGTDILTLSAGAMFSRIPDLSYEARKTPNSATNVLTVEGDSRATPSLVALLNYSLGALRLDGDAAGLALSAGPVIRLGGKSDASAFGFFTGLSGHLAHRFYVTPGIHFGQYSDFPVGFGNGGPVPSDFGELTPVKRWTARFGLAVSFKTKDFSGLVSSDAPSVTGSEAGSGAARPETPKPADDSDEVSQALSNRLKRSFLRTRKGSAAGTEFRPIAESAPDFKPEPSRSASSVPLSSGPRVTSLHSSMSSADERVSIEATAPIRDYAMYFKAGRFYLVMPRTGLDAIQDDLRGRVFSDPMIERRGDDLVLSLALWPDTRVSVLERLNGLDLVLISPKTK
jgi:hypothetical protein